LIISTRRRQTTTLSLRKPFLLDTALAGGPTFGGAIGFPAIEFAERDALRNVLNELIHQEAPAAIEDAGFRDYLECGGVDRHVILSQSGIRSR
jgi:hypothetical protein